MVPSVKVRRLALMNEVGQNPADYHLSMRGHSPSISKPRHRMPTRRQRMLFQVDLVATRISAARWRRRKLHHRVAGQRGAKVAHRRRFNLDGGHAAQRAATGDARGIALYGPAWARRVGQLGKQIQGSGRIRLAATFGSPSATWRSHSAILSALSARSSAVSRNTLSHGCARLLGRPPYLG